MTTMMMITSANCLFSIQPTFTAYNGHKNTKCVFWRWLPFKPELAYFIKCSWSLSCCRNLAFSEIYNFVFLRLNFHTDVYNKYILFSWFFSHLFYTIHVLTLCLFENSSHVINICRPSYVYACCYTWQRPHASYGYVTRFCSRSTVSSVSFHSSQQAASSMAHRTWRAVSTADH